MFNGPSEAQSYEQNVQQAADNLLNAFRGGEFKTAIAVLDWMKEAVAVNACVIGPENGVSPCGSSPSFPVRYLKVKE
ncbi:hypothetical protein [Klebsiella pneumoniae]|uniref:hypothetical protein n=1 Tax=Klebsiella pneumoniae TaxID=573 RepID=UPI001154B04D|nr:hypothetical protein [Klebsiella pneumoniae]HDO7096618.1 hypothetical protein [Klebsiella pneumoniae]